MKMARPVTVYIDDDKEIDSINLKPLAAKLATTSADPSPSSTGHQASAHTTSACVTATLVNGVVDATADVTLD